MGEIIELLPSDHELLKQKIPLFDFKNPPTDPIELAHTLAKSMLSHGGIGLAANQIGLPYRAFAIMSNPIIVVFNPRIVDMGEELIELEEGCLTFPNLFLKIKRPKNIRVRYTQPNGEVVTNTYTGMTARIFQHETDHLDGVLFTEHVGPVALALAKSKAKKHVKA